MKNSYDTYTNEKKISYEQKQFLKASLCQIGMNPKTSGFRIFQEIILIAYSKDTIIINLEEIYQIIAKKNSSIQPSGIKSLARRSFENINTKKLFKNYENIFDMEYSADYFSISNLVSDFKDILETME